MGEIELDREEFEELFLGTWTAIALIVESLIERAVLPRHELLEVMKDARALARDRRGTAIAGVELLIQRFGSDPERVPRAGLWNTSEAEDYDERY